MRRRRVCCCGNDSSVPVFVSRIQRHLHVLREDCKASYGLYELLAVYLLEPFGYEHWAPIHPRPVEWATYRSGPFEDDRPVHNIPANSTCPGFGELYAKTLGQSCTYSIRLIKAKCTCTRQHSVSKCSEVPDGGDTLPFTNSLTLSHPLRAASCPLREEPAGRISLRGSDGMVGKGHAARKRKKGT